MRARRFSSHTTPAQAQRRAAWADYTHDGRWWGRRTAWLASTVANAHCPGCGRTVGERDDVHHLHYPAVPGTEADEDLVLLCRNCHETVHASIDASLQLRRMDRRQATWTVLNTLYRNHQSEGIAP